MPTLSLKKIFTAIVGIMILIHLKKILRAIQPGYFWICESLEGLRYFEKDAQTAIAIMTIILIMVLVLKTFNK